MERDFSYASPYMMAENNPVFMKDYGGNTAHAYYDPDKNKIIITSAVVLYTGDKDVYNKINTNQLQTDLNSAYNNVTHVKDDGSTEVGPPTMEVEINGVMTTVEVEFQIEVIKSYDEVYNKDHGDDIDQMSLDYLQAVRDDVPSMGNSDNSGYYNYMRVEKGRSNKGVSDFVHLGNTGFLMFDELSSTTITHEFGHGLGMKHPVDEQGNQITSMNPDEYNGVIHIGWNQYVINEKTGTEIDKTQRVVTQNDIINIIPMDGFTISNTIDNPYVIGDPLNQSYTIPYPIFSNKEGYNTAQIEAGMNDTDDEDSGQENNDKNQNQNQGGGQ
jgi:hypothetical protein